MAHKKAGGSTSNLKDSQSKRLGVKLHDGQFAKAGSIIIRQRGTKFNPGANVMLGKDFTIFAISDGYVKFTEKQLTGFDNQKKRKKIVSIVTEKTTKK